MANKNTLTQVQALSYAIALINLEPIGDEVDEDVIVAKLTAMRDTLANKSHSVNKAEMAKRSALTNRVLSALEALNKPVTVSELQRSDDTLQTYNGEIVSGQRITSILTALVKDGKVVNAKDKKKSYFSLVK